MVDGRIYRAAIVFAAIGVIVFGFSLQSQPGPDSTAVAAPAYAPPVTLAQLLAARSGGNLAAYVDQELGQAVGSGSGFSVSQDRLETQTAAGARAMPVVVASRTGSESGTLVVVSDRDEPGPAGVSSTQVLLALARALAAESEHRSVMLVSIGSPAGAAGAAALARWLAASAQPVDAVIVLGDVAAQHPTKPIVVPYADTEALAPPVLTQTLARYVGAQTGLPAGGADFAAQFAHLAVPLSLTDQGPFAAYGIPAALVSLRGDRLSTAAEAIAQARPAEVFAAVAQALYALDAAPTVPSPSAYLVLSGKTVPLWAVRLLVLVLILPVAMTTVDAVARARRRGHSITRWMIWALAGSIPFLAAAVVVLLARAVGMISAAPPALTGAGAIHAANGALAAVALAGLVFLVALLVVRPLILRLALARLASGRRRPSTPGGDGAAVALSAVSTLAAIAAWVVNPFAAALLVPALHLWLWLGRIELRERRWLAGLLALGGALPLVALVAYYAHSLGLESPSALVWSAALLIAGGGISPGAVVVWAVGLGCLADALIIAVRASRPVARTSRIEPAVTVRGPVGYAGPGSLGGTESALRR